MSSVSSKKMKNFKKPEAEERLAAAGRVPRGRQPGYGGNEAGRLLPPGTVLVVRKTPPAMPGVKIAYSERKNSLIR